MRPHTKSRQGKLNKASQPDTDEGTCSGASCQPTHAQPPAAAERAACRFAALTTRHSRTPASDSAATADSGDSGRSDGSIGIVGVYSKFTGGGGGVACRARCCGRGLAPAAAGPAVSLFDPVPLWADMAADRSARTMPVLSANTVALSCLGCTCASGEGRTIRELDVNIPTIVRGAEAAVHHQQAAPAAAVQASVVRGSVCDDGSTRRQGGHRSGQCTAAGVCCMAVSVPAASC